MFLAILPVLVSLVGAKTHNPADCQLLPVEQQVPCVQAIRAGRSVEIQVEQPALAPSQEDAAPPPPSAQAEDRALRERAVRAAEAQAASTHTIAVVNVIELSIAAVAFLVIMFGFRK